MTFGDPPALRSLAAQCRQAAEHSAACTDRGHRSVGSMVSGADARSRLAADALASRWDETYRVLERAVSSTHDVALALGTLADVLERCARDWYAGSSAAAVAGFTVHAGSGWVTVTAPTTATPAEVTQGGQLANQLQAVLGAAETARRSVHAVISGGRVAGLTTLDAGRGSVPWPDTGDDGLDAALRDYLAPLAGVHEMVLTSSGGHR